MKFQVDDIVQCIDGSLFEYYTGKNFKPYTGCLMKVDKADERYINGWTAEYFRLVERKGWIKVNIIEGTNVVHKVKEIK